jgi:hypothetical protein
MQDDPNLWSHLFMDSTDREEIFKGNKVYQRADHRRIWVLAGHRLRGLNVYLYKELLDMNGLILTLKRDILKTQPYWELYINDSDSPFSRRALKVGS